MATRSRTSFNKRQKEIARMEKQRDKAAKRLQRKQGEKTPEQESNSEEPESWAAEEPAGESNVTDQEGSVGTS